MICYKCGNTDGVLLQPTEPEEIARARNRQAVRNLYRALERINKLASDLDERSWITNKILGIKEEVGRAYDLLAHLQDPDDLLDEMADL